MAIYYLETSALVKLYVREAGTQHMLRLASSLNGNRFAVVVLSQVELRSAIRRRERAGDLDAKQVAIMLDRFQFHMKNRFLLQTVTDTVLDTAARIIDSYLLRAYDAVQLAACLVLKKTTAGHSLTFVCADHQLLQAAQSERVAVLDPTAPGP